MKNLACNCIFHLGFDAPQVFYSDNFGSQDGDGQGDLANNLAVKKRFKEFLRQFHDGGHTAFSYKYRDALKRNYALHQYWINVNLEDVASFDEAIADKLYKAPSDFLPLFEEAATEVIFNNYMRIRDQFKFLFVSKQVQFHIFQSSIFLGCR